MVIFRDVVERHGVENLPALRYLERSLLASPAGRFSVSKLFNDLKSQGIKVGKDTLYEYLAHLEDSFLLFTVPVASASVRVRQVNPRKCYPVDPALASALSFRASEDLGHLLETAVYLELRRRGRPLGYVTTRNGYEVDFLAEDSGGSRELIQVCADLESTRQREFRALEEGMKETGWPESHRGHAERRRLRRGRRADGPHRAGLALAAGALSLLTSRLRAA